MARSPRLHALALGLCGLMTTTCVTVDATPPVTNQVTDWRDEIIYQIAIAIAVAPAAVIPVARMTRSVPDLLHGLAGARRQGRAPQAKIRGPPG